MSLSRKVDSLNSMPGYSANIRNTEPLYRNMLRAGLSMTITLSQEFRTKGRVSGGIGTTKWQTCGILIF